MRTQSKEQLPRSVIFASFLVALLVDVKSVNYVYGAILGTEGDGFTSLLFPFIAVASLLTCMVQRRSLLKEVNPLVWVLSVFIMGFYFYTTQTIATPRVPLPFLLGFTILAFIIPSLLTIDTCTTLKAIMVIPAVGVFWLKSVFVPEEENELGLISMMRSYAFLVPVLANILYIMLYYKRDTTVQRRFILILSIVNAIYLYQIMKYGSRGPFFCIISLIVFNWLVKKDDMGRIRWNAGKNLTFGVVAISLVLFFREIMIGLSTFLHLFGLHLNVIDKYVRKAVEIDDMTNGRAALTARCLEDIPEHPFVGHGMDTFEHFTGIIYPHNFILQIFYDGGFLLTGILLIPVVWSMLKKIRFGRRETYALTLFLLFFSVPGALMSTDLWQNERLWIFFGAMLSSTFIYKGNKAKK